jgi:hypothetical protein
MQDKVNKLDGGAKQLKELILQAKEDTIFWKLIFSIFTFLSY